MKDNLVCPSCGKKFEKLRFKCDSCGTMLKYNGEDLNNEVSSEIEKVNAEEWFQKCPVCKKYNKLLDSNNKKEKCEFCGNPEIRQEDVFKRTIRSANTDNKKVKSKFKVRSFNDEEDNEEEIEENSDNSDVIEENKEEDKIKYVELENLFDGKKINIQQGKYMVGAEGDIEPGYFWPNIYVGRRHFIIEVTAKEVSVMDNDSKNWTKINTRRIVKADGPQQLQDGDKLMVADMLFEVHICK